MSEQSLPRDAHPEYADTLPEYAERVLDVAARLPAGRGMTDGDGAAGVRAAAQRPPPGGVRPPAAVAEWLEEGGPRQVGRVMALYGSPVPWWRVVRADGVLLPGHELEALGRYRAEGTPLKEASRAAEGHLPRLDMRRARWDGDERAEGHT